VFLFTTFFFSFFLLYFVSSFQKKSISCRKSMTKYKNACFHICIEHCKSHNTCYLTEGKSKKLNLHHHLISYFSLLLIFVLPWTSCSCYLFIFLLTIEKYLKIGSSYQHLHLCLINMYIAFVSQQKNTCSRSPPASKLLYSSWFKIYLLHLRTCE